MTDYNAGDRNQVKRARKGAKQKEQQRLRGLKGLLDSADGRVWLWDLLGQCGVFRLSFSGVSTHQTSFNEGQRNVGLRVQADLVAHFPAEFVGLMNEHREPERSRPEPVERDDDDGEHDIDGDDSSSDD